MATSIGENPIVEGENGRLGLCFDGHLRLEFRGAKVTTDTGLLAARELDGALGLTEMAGIMICDKRTGRNIRHQTVGLLRQSVYARLAGYEDVNDQERLFCDPAMRAVIGRKTLEREAEADQDRDKDHKSCPKDGLPGGEGGCARGAVRRGPLAHPLPGRSFYLKQYRANGDCI